MGIKMDKLEEIKSNINLVKSIKSFYVFEWVFSFLDDNKKLNMIIYSKEL